MKNNKAKWKKETKWNFEANENKKKKVEKEIKQNEINWKGDTVRKRNDENKELKQYERNQNRENKNEMTLIQF